MKSLRTFLVEKDAYDEYLPPAPIKKFGGFSTSGTSHGARGSTLDIIASYDFYLPLRSAFIERNYEDKFKKRIIAFHITELSGLFDLLKLQGTAKSISCFTQHLASSDRGLTRGVETNGGILVKLEGLPILSRPADAYSILDKDGYRWYRMDKLESASGDYTIQNQCFALRDNILKKYYSLAEKAAEENEDFAKEYGFGGHFGSYRWQATLAALYMTNKREFGKVIKEYLDELEKIAIKYKQFLLNYNDFEIKTQRSENSSYNEVLLSRVKILEVGVCLDRLNFYNYRIPGISDREFEECRVNGELLMKKLSSVLKPIPVHTKPLDMFLQAQKEQQ